MLFSIPWRKPIFFSSGTFPLKAFRTLLCPQRWGCSELLQRCDSPTEAAALPRDIPGTGSWEPHPTDPRAWDQLLPKPCLLTSESAFFQSQLGTIFIRYTKIQKSHLVRAVADPHFFCSFREKLLTLQEMACL